jgi:hypothetical protein
LELLEPRYVLDSTVVFNEIMYHPLGAEPLEFIELYNQMGVDMDVSSWRLAGAVDFRFVEGTVVPSDGYLVVAENPQAFKQATGVDALGPYDGRLANGGEELELRDRNDRRMDHIVYSDATPWPAEADGWGASLAKRDRNTISQPAEHWVSSVQVGGTPGAANFADQLAAPPEDRVQTVVDFSSTWQWNAAGQDLGTNWREPGAEHNFDQSAAGVFYAGNARLDSATLEPLTNVTATASSELAGHEASQTVDGSGLTPGGGHATSNAFENMWQSVGSFLGGQDTNPEITFDLGADRVIEAMRVWNYNQVESASCCLNRGIRLADVLVAGSDGVFATQIDDQAFDRATGDTSTAAQQIDLSGVSARYIKLDVDTTNGVANHGDPFQFVGLSEVQLLAYPPAGDTQLLAGPNTYYFRHEFDFNEAPERTTLALKTLLDDGAIVYLNGQEVYRQNLLPGAVNYQTRAALDVPHASESETISLPIDALLRGRNVLAVEVHQAKPQDSDMVFGLELIGTTRPAESLPDDVSPIVIQELGPAGANEFFVELRNQTDRSLDLSDYRVAFGNGTSYRFPSPTTLGPGMLTTVRSATHGIPSQAGETLALYNAAGDQVLSAAEISVRAQARQPDGSGPLLTPVQPTPGQPNSIPLDDRIVINEIMYNHRADVADPGTPPTIELDMLVALDGTWRMNQSGEALPSNWPTTAHPLGGNWTSGTGLIGFETGPVVPPGLGTQITDPRENGIVTYYFETDFQVTAAQRAAASNWRLRHVIDDGAVFYLNGVEILRFSMPEGEFDASTPASVSVNNAATSDPIEFSNDLLVEGTNRLSVEVHQRTATSNDVVFGAEVAFARQLDSGIPATPYRENDEEWIELYNRSSESVDLSGWRLDDAVEYSLPAGTQLEPGEYLVIARDSAALRQKFPDVSTRIVGNFNGSLSNFSERIRLLDQRGNPADEVQYYEGGQWQSAADGRGSSLELRDPLANNSIGLAWAASDESQNSSWQTYTYRGIASSSSVGPDGQWQELLLGLLSDGEVLLDDIHVIENPSLGPVDLIQNGSFETDTLGTHAEHWRLIGNHRHSEVIVDPEDASNQVLRFVATGAAEHMHNHAETTLKNGNEIAVIRNGVEYEISYRAKWISGSNLLNSRLYFNRLPRTTPITQPDAHGTPGRQNSRYVENLGPVYHDFAHSPVVPDAGQPVTVSVNIVDSQAIASATLWYSIEGGSWNSVSMSKTTGTAYAAQVPGQSEGEIVQFYVMATDALGAATTFPREGPDSRALFQVQDGLSSDVGLHNLRLILTPADAAHLHSEVELMSNDPTGATLIYNEQTVFYDASVRLSGSQRARPFQPRLSFNVNFNADQLFRGVHGSFTLDRSESTGFGQREHIYHHGMNHAGGLPTEYNDLFHIITPQRSHTGSAEVQLARYSDILLDEQFDNGSDGQLYEYELVYYPTTTVGGDPEGRKRPQPDSVSGTAIRHLSDNKDDYRWVFLNKNNRQQDDYSQLIEFTKIMQLPTAQFIEQIDSVIDVDQWMRAFAFGVITGHGDSYTSDGAQHNVQFYIRPSDGRVMQFPHDLDAFFDPNRPIAANGDLRKIISAPANEHMYYGHVEDMIQTTFNEQYMQRWIDHWQSLLPSQRFDTHLTGLVRRSDVLMTQIERAAPRVDFEITTGNTQVDTNAVTLAGNGWVNVREIRLAGSSAALPVQWTDVTVWQADVPVAEGTNAVVLEAYDFQGQLIGSDTVTVVSTAPNPVGDSLRISELNYHPFDPTAAELAAIPGLDDNDFEFIELTNIGAQPINLLGVSFTAGVVFDFPSMTLAGGETAVVVQNEAAFRLRYGMTPRILGTLTDGQLSNSGERVALADAHGTTILDFAYSDDSPWPNSADGQGPTLSLIDPAGTPASEYTNAQRWAASLTAGGNPGQLTTDGDLDGNGSVNVADIDFLCEAIGADDEAFDLNGDGQLSADDLVFFVESVLRSAIGDTNLDGLFNSSDLVRIFQVGEYEDGISGNSTWADGDWDCDGEFGTSDLVLAFQRGSYTAAAQGIWILATDADLAAAVQWAEIDDDAKTDNSRLDPQLADEYFSRPLFI